MLRVPVPYTPTLPVEIRVAWRKRDPEIERDAEIFWRNEGLLPPNVSVAERLSELCIAGYHEGKLVGVVTASVRYFDFLTAKLAMLRVAVARDYRKQMVAGQLLIGACELLEDWSQANYDEHIMGTGTISQPGDANAFGLGVPYSPAMGQVFIGWTANGEQMRIGWFPHAWIPVRLPKMPVGGETG